MIIFITYKEGGEFEKLYMKYGFRPNKFPQPIFPKKCIVIFKCGMIWDGFLRSSPKMQSRIRTHWRHCLDGGRREGKMYYQQLLRNVK